MTIAALVFATCVLGLVLFQLGLAAGRPWGHLAMGGRFPGVFPPAMRVVALLIAALYLAIAALVLARAGLAFGGLSLLARQLAWPVMALGLLGTILNLITPSRPERLLWGPVSLLMFVTSVIILWD